MHLYLKSRIFALNKVLPTFYTFIFMANYSITIENRNLINLYCNNNLLGTLNLSTFNLTKAYIQLGSNIINFKYLGWFKSDMQLLLNNIPIFLVKSNWTGNVRKIYELNNTLTPIYIIKASGFFKKEFQLLNTANHIIIALQLNFSFRKFNIAFDINQIDALKLNNENNYLILVVAYFGMLTRKRNVAASQA